MTDRRIVLGLVVQPFFTFLLAVVTLPVYWSVLSEGRPMIAPPGHLAAVRLAAAILAVITVSVALPIILWLRDRGHLSLGRVLLGGMVLGNALGGWMALASIIAIATGHVGSAASPRVLGGVFTMGSLFGLAGAGLFWLIACRSPRAAAP